MLANRQSGMRGAGAIMILVALIVGLVPLMAGADGEDSPAECELAFKLEVDDGSREAREATLQAPEGYIIDVICIKSGDQAFGDLKHSGLITADGVYSGFTVAGLGTGTVTVTAAAGVKDISHVDYSIMKAPPEDSRARFEKDWVGETDEIADLVVMVTVTYRLDDEEHQTTFVDTSEWITVRAGKTLTYVSESVDFGEGADYCEFEKRDISHHSFTAPVEGGKDKTITITNEVSCEQPDPEPIALNLEKVWTGAEFDQSNLEVTLLIDGVAGPVEVEDGQSVVITEAVTGLPEQCTYTSDIVSPYLVDSDDAVDGMITVEVSNEVSCAQDQVTSTTVKPTTPDEKQTEVLPIVVTTTTTTVPTEVLPVEVISSVVAQTLPYTGPDDLGWLYVAAGALALGSMLVLGSRREESQG